MKKRTVSLLCGLWSASLLLSPLALQAEEANEKMPLIEEEDFAQDSSAASETADGGRTENREEPPAEFREEKDDEDPSGLSGTENELDAETAERFDWVEITSADQLDPALSQRQTAVAVEAMNDGQITPLFESVLAFSREYPLQILAVVHSGEGSPRQSGLCAQKLASLVSQEDIQSVVPAVILDSGSRWTGPAYLMEFLEMYESQTGIRGAGIAAGAARDLSDWNGWPERYGFSGSIEELKQSINAQKFSEMTTAAAGFDQAPSVYRLYNPNTGEHFYTTDARECEALRQYGWKYESLAWSAHREGQEIFRLYNPNNGGDHHYTTNAQEADYLTQAGWVFEGTAFSGDPEQSLPVWRLYNPNALVNNHHFTTSETERNALIQAGWNDEGTAFYARTPMIPFRYVRADNYLIGSTGYSPRQTRLSGVERVSGRPYLFGSTGEMIREQNIHTLNTGEKVFVQHDGTLAERGLISWQSHVYYFDGSCRMVRSRDVAIGELSYHFNQNGHWDNQSDVEVQKLCLQVYRQRGREMKSLFDYVASFSYVSYPIHVTPPAGWSRALNYAQIGLNKRHGHCYIYAASLWALLKNAGYDAYYIEGGVRMVNGGVGPHGWVEINYNGGRYILDPELQWELRNSGRYIFMQSVGAPAVSYVR